MRTQIRTQIRAQIRPMLTLALPLILAELGWMSMGIVDTIMVGHMAHPVLAIAAAALGQVLYNTVAFGIAGVLLGLDTYLAQSHGAGRLDEANRWLQHGLLLAAGLAVALMLIIAAAPMALMHLPADHDVLLHASSFLEALNWGTPPLLLAFVLRRYLQAFNHVKPIAISLVTANVVNAVVNWILIYGHHWGPIQIPALGVRGSGLSTAISRLYLAAFMAIAVYRLDRRHKYGLRAAPRDVDLTRITRLLSLGAPAGAGIFVEISIFGAVTFLIGTMGPLPLAGHEIALNCASFTFMIPFAISAAAAVRVGQAIGRRSPSEATAAGWAAIFLGAAAMATCALVLAGMPNIIAGAFTRDATVIAATVPLLYIAAAFQFFDGVQITANGALRGAGDTHTGLIVQLIGYWLIALPLGYYLGFHRHLGPAGLWIGLCTGLIVAAASLAIKWRYTTHHIPDAA